MKGILRAATASGILLSCAALGLQAQARVTVGLGGGVVLPMKSGFRQVENPNIEPKSLGFGGELIIGIMPKADSKVGFRVDFGYQNVHYDAPTTPTRDKDPKMSIRNANLDLVLHPGSSSGKIRPYVMVGPSFVSWDYRPNVGTLTGKVKGSFGFNGGVGINFGAGDKLGFFAESRFIWTKDQAVAQGTNGGTEKGTSFVPIMVGIRIMTKGTPSR